MIPKELLGPSDLTRALVFRIYELLEVKKLGSPIALIFGTCVGFLDILFLDEFTTVLLALSSTSTTLLLLALNAFGVKSNDPIALTVK